MSYFLNVNRHIRIFKSLKSQQMVTAPYIILYTFVEFGITHIPDNVVTRKCHNSCHNVINVKINLRKLNFLRSVMCKCILLEINELFWSNRLSTKEY